MRIAAFYSDRHRLRRLSGRGRLFGIDHEPANAVTVRDRSVHRDVTLPRVAF